MKLAQSDTHRGTPRNPNGEALTGPTAGVSGGGSAAAAAAAQAASTAAAAAGRAATSIQEFALFIGDLSPTVTDAILETHFKLRFPSVVGAKVIDESTKNRPNRAAGQASKVYGFVRFSNEAESLQALQQLNNTWLMSKYVRCDAMAIPTCRAAVRCMLMVSAVTVLCDDYVMVVIHT